MDFEDAVRRGNAEQLAQAYLKKYYGDTEIKFPINPFQMLKDEGVDFSLLDLNKLEGLYIPKQDANDLPVVGINANRPITRQRFTAAHELCHHLRDSDKAISCPQFGKKNPIEKYADKFAAALLMPADVFAKQIAQYIGEREYLTFDDLLRISDYFGVSFEACVFRAAYSFHVVEGETDSHILKSRISLFHPESVRRQLGLTYAGLYADLLDSYSDQLKLQPERHAEYVFENEYIFNDSRMEGLDVDLEQASEIVTDLRMNTLNSPYCTEDNEAFLSIAGHYALYHRIFDSSSKNDISVFDMIGLHKLLFQYYPFPDFGGSLRDIDTLVLGARFDTVDPTDIVPMLLKIDATVKDQFKKKDSVSLSEYLMHVVTVHHALTVIHPFKDGNGRITRAFMNMQLLSAGMIPIYIKIGEEKEEYVEALAIADRTGNMDALFEVIVKSMLRIYVDLNKHVFEIEE